MNLLRRNPRRQPPATARILSGNEFAHPRSQVKAGGAATVASARRYPRIFTSRGAAMSSASSSIRHARAAGEERRPSNAPARRSGSFHQVSRGTSAAAEKADHGARGRPSFTWSLQQENEKMKSKSNLRHRADNQGRPLSDVEVDQINAKLAHQQKRFRQQIAKNAAAIARKAMRAVPEVR